MIERFVRRLKAIGIEVTLVGNYPWVYLDTVNGKKVTEKFRAKHGFTVFMGAWSNNVPPWKFTYSKEVFQKIRDML